MDLIEAYFPELTGNQLEQFRALLPLYADWNARINVISRKDLDQFYVHHVLHSLALTKVLNPASGETVVDFGTGGGFPSVALAIYYPENPILAVDSIGKKMTVVSAVKEALQLPNLEPITGRIEALKPMAPYYVNRAVSALPQLLHWVLPFIQWKNLSGKGSVAGLYSLKGGDLFSEMLDAQRQFPRTITHSYALKEWFHEPFFETKSVLLTTLKS